MLAPELLPVLIIGTGQLAHAAQEILAEVQADVYGFVSTGSDPIADPDPSLEVPVVGKLEDAAIRKMLQTEKLDYCIALEEPAMAIKLLSALFELTNRLPITLISPKASVSPGANVAQGVVVHPFVTVQAGVNIEALSVLYPNACVCAQAGISKGARIGPGAVLDTGASVGECTRIGALAYVRTGVKVGAHATVAPGSVVMANVEDEEIVFGNPAKSIPA
jgi:UDP-3-O-[3-hydroxymyristoyl] glucosamine N-acyltransferase